jgi:hypothetical protein
MWLIFNLIKSAQNRDRSCWVTGVGVASSLARWPEQGAEMPASSSRSEVSRYAGKCFQCLTKPAVECRFEGDSQSKLHRLKALISKWSNGTWVTKDSESFQYRH